MTWLFKTAVSLANIDDDEEFIIAVLSNKSNVQYFLFINDLKIDYWWPPNSIIQSFKLLKITIDFFMIVHRDMQASVTFVTYLKNHANPRSTNFSPTFYTILLNAPDPVPDYRIFTGKYYIVFP